MDDVDKHWLSHVKTCFVLYMAVTKCYKTVQMSQKWSEANSRMAKPAQYLLLFNALACVLVTVFKFTSKHIGPLYVLQAVSHLGFLLSYLCLVKFSDLDDIQKKGAAVVKKLTPLIPVYLLVIVYGYFGLGNCTEEQPYPWSFVLGDCVFFVTYFLVSGFGIKDIKKLEPANNEEKKRRYNLALAQFEAFFGKYKQMAMWHGLELVLGRFMLKTVFDGALICGGEGKEWHYRSALAHFFLILHILGTVQALGTQSSILIKSVKKHQEKEAKKEN